MHTTAHTPIEYLERSARLFPSKTAVIDEFGTCTYAELLERSRAIAQGLLAADARSSASGNPEIRVAGSVNAPAPQPVVIFMEKRIDMLASFLGALMAGCFYVPVACRASAKRLCHAREWGTGRKRPDRDRERRYHNRGAGNLSGRPRSARG